jgi:beta-lactamase regulating signal transducer with metallopeptidase domain
MSMLLIDAVIPPAAWMILKVSLLLTAAAIVQALLGRRRSAATRHLMWTLALVGVLILPMLSAVMPQWEAVRLPASSVPGGTPRLGSAGPADMTQPVPVGGVLNAASPAVAIPVESRPAPPTSSRVSWRTTLLALYGVGVVLLLIRLVFERLTMRSLARQATSVSDPEGTRLLLECAGRIGIRRPVRLLRSRERTMPMAFGIRVPAILIPVVSDTWTEDRRRAVLLHELAHVARHDCLTQLLAAVACAFYWFHPGVWWAARRLRVERELACDDRVLAAGTHARDYAGHLLELAYALGRTRVSALAVSMARPRQLEGRMLAVLDTARNRANPGRRGRLAGLAIAAALLVPLAGAQATVVPSGAPNTSAPRPPAVGSTPRASIDVPLSDRVPNDVDRLKPALRAETAQAVTRASAQDSLFGTWDIRPTGEAGTVHLTLTESDGTHGSTIRIERLTGLSPAQMTGTSGLAHFAIRRDAGTFTLDGIFRGGVGAGTYAFSPNATFSDELAKRGLARPTAAQQYVLARHDVGLAFLDELTAQGYTRPDLPQLVRAAEHGVDFDYLREMGRVGYRLALVEALIRQRDHGVSPQFIRELASLGLPGLSSDDLVRARDNGVSPEYVRALGALGYSKLPLDELVRLRNNGVSAEYVRELDALGYKNLSRDEVIRLRNNGVSAEYVRELDALGYKNLARDEVIRLRNNGVSAEYVRELDALGYKNLARDEVIRLRNNGVSAEYVRALGALGYRNLSRDDVIRLRNHGVDPEYVRQLKDLGYNRLSIDELVDLRNRGVTPEGIRSANLRAGIRIAIDRLKALAAAGGLLK